MQVLLDECVPRPVKRELPDYQVRTDQPSVPHSLHERLAFSTSY